MGLFDKEYCDICGEKVNKLTQKKVSDGRLCSDCKHKLGALTGGWKTRTISDVKAHFAARETDKSRFAQFHCSASAGTSNNSIQVDFDHQWFVFAIENRDYQTGHPQVFDFDKLQDFWMEQEFRTVTDSDHDGIPDNRDRFDNRQMGGGILGGVLGGVMNTAQMGMNVPVAAQEFIRNSTSSTSFGSTMKEVSGVKAVFRVQDPYIVDPISFSLTGFTLNSNPMELMRGYEAGVKVMQLCRQMKQGTAVQSGVPTPQPAGNPTITRQSAPTESAQPTEAAAWFCQSCGQKNTGKFCSACGSPKLG